MVPSAHETMSGQADQNFNSRETVPFRSSFDERTNGSISGRNASKNECAERGISRLNAFLDELKIHGFSPISNWRKRSRNVFIELNFYTAYPKMYFGTPLVKFLQW